MMEFISANMAPIMFASLVVFLLFGYSVAFSLGACGLFFGFVGVKMGLMPEALLNALPLRVRLFTDQAFIDCAVDRSAQRPYQRTNHCIARHCSNLNMKGDI